MKKRIIALFVLTLALTNGAKAQLAEGKKNIDKLCGCFEIEFKYAETFAPDPAYKFHDRDYSSATELVMPIEMSDKKIVLQHLLVISNEMIIKHWREDWTYESPVIYKYEGDKKWTKHALSADQAKGKWTQTVWEVDDAPRYQGQSTWLTNNGKTYWENTTDAPLPRREYTHRNDYNIMNRGNRLVLTENGFDHEQDNRKILRENGQNKLIAQETGINSYTKAPESKCAGAKAWWEKNKAFWTVVRDEWKQYTVANTIQMKAKVDDKVLNEHLAALMEEWSNNKVKQSELPVKVKEVLSKFL